MVTIQIPEKIGAIFQDPAKTYRGGYGGRGSAKTISFAKMSIAEMIRLEGEPWKFLCGRELQKSLKDSVFSVIASQIEEMRVTEHFDVGREYIRAKNGNEYLFYGLRTNIAEVKGLHGVRRTWLEEAQKVSQSSLNYLIPTVMRDFPDCELWASWNPDEEEDPIHQMFVDNADDSFAVCKINYYDNPWFPESLDKVRLRDLKNNPEQYGWIWEGSFNVNHHASVYGKWVEKAKSDGRFRENIYDPSLPVFTAWDLGYSDDTAIWWFQVAGNELRLIDYYENNRQDMKHYAEQIYGREIVDIQYGENGKVLSYKLGAVINERRTQYQYGDQYVPHDAANKLLQAGGRSIVDQLHEFGIKSRIVHATSQQNQIAAARASIDLAWFDEEHCKQGIRCLKKYAFEERDGERGYSTTPKHDIYSHGCFVGNTEVLTHSGSVRIMDLPYTGKVRTNRGWKTYINPRVTRKNAELVEVIFSDGLIVKCTPDHLFMTARGWKSAESLNKDMEILSSLGMCKYSTELSTSFGLAKDILLGKLAYRVEKFTIGLKDCIEKFGSALLVKFPMIATFITRMGILKTTHCRTLSVCNQTNTLDLRGRKHTIRGGWLALATMLEERPQIGTNQKRAEDGIAATRRPLLARLKKNALNAIKLISALIEKTAEQIRSIAPPDARTLRVLSVKNISERQDVWCLTVPDVGHFSLSNGAIVKNCDAFEVVAQIWKSAKVDAPPAAPRFLEEMTVNEIFYGETPKSGISRI